MAGIREAVAAVASGRLDPRPLYTHVYPLERLGEALDATRDRPDGFLKALVTRLMAPPVAPRVRASASWASAGSAATAWRRSSRPAPSRSRPSPTLRPRRRPRRRRLAPGARLVSTLDELLDLGLDGVVIATPSALHAEQSIRALERGAAVFCQKPLGRTAAEARAVVDAARAADRLLGVDLSYRFTEGMRRIREIVRAGELGRVYAVDLVFHNAYGPDKPWFYDPALAGGGCVMDLGVHLVDLALWTLDFPEVAGVSGTPLRRRRAARPTRRRGSRITRSRPSSSRPAPRCSSPARGACRPGCDADHLGRLLRHRRRGARSRNVDGSFYDFIAERYRGTARETLSGAAGRLGRPRRRRLGDAACRGRALRRRSRAARRCRPRAGPDLRAMKAGRRGRVRRTPPPGLLARVHGTLNVATE